MDNRTRWSSWYQVIDRAIRKKDKIQSFMSDHEEAIGDNRLLVGDWELLGKVHTFLQPFASATLYAEGDDSSISQSLMLMDMLLLHYEEQQKIYQSDEHSDERMVRAIDMGWFILSKYYRLTDEVPVYAAALLLDPRKRIAYIKQNWPKEWHEDTIASATAFWQKEFNYEQPSDHPSTPTSMPPPLAKKPNQLAILSKKLEVRTINASVRDDFTSFINVDAIDIPPDYINKIKDDFTNAQPGFSFVSHPDNGFDAMYQDLLIQVSITSYLQKVAALEENISGGLLTACGQSPRLRELLSLAVENSPCAVRGIFIWNGSVAYALRHHKAKRSTNQEFHVVRFLPARLSVVVVKHLICIRRLAALLQREQSGLTRQMHSNEQKHLLFQHHGKPWASTRITRVVRAASKHVWDWVINARVYRQLAIGITEKHVREVYSPFNRYDDNSSDADLNVAFAWQSGHRPLQRGITYGLDGAYPHQLQPSLLRAYQWASTKWHEFLHQASKSVPLLDTGCPLVPSRSMCSSNPQASTPPTADSKQQVTTTSRKRKRISHDGGKRSIEKTFDSSPPVLTHAAVRIDGIAAILPEYPILVCLICKAAVRPDKGIGSHFRHTHCLKGEMLKAVYALHSGRTLRNPLHMPPRDKESRAISDLKVKHGYSCKACTYLTISKDNLVKHRSQSHPELRVSDERQYEEMVIIWECTIQAASPASNRSVNQLARRQGAGEVDYLGVGTSRRLLDLPWKRANRPVPHPSPRHAVSRLPWEVEELQGYVPADGGRNQASGGEGLVLVALFLRIHPAISNTRLENMVDKLGIEDSRVTWHTATIRHKNYHYMKADPDNEPLATIFLLHGFPGLAFGWRYQIPCLQSRGYQIIAPDMLGFGLSSAPCQPSLYALRSIAEDIRDLANLVAKDKKIILGGHEEGYRMVQICFSNEIIIQNAPNNPDG
ncbi:restless-like transposase [Fusarium austroafricanum]|uniref:Restless-like transposase n=1 Tax=Fusarium austroafricanum TaxID=2364996 RepID=A0A8H4NHE5_9HYPO|nr:restless-like transposase [Fusarium austroafricanum]